MEVIFLLAGLVFIAVSVGIVLAELHERRGMQPTRARVIGFSTGRSKPNGPSFYSVAQYAGPDGCNYYVEGVVGSSVPLHNVGDEVTVLVNPAQPGKAALKSSTSFALGSFLALMGLAGTLVFWLTFRASWYSLIAAAVIAAGFAMQIKKAWREYKRQIFSPRVFTDQSKNTISWADPVSLNAARRSYQRSNSFGVPLLIACGIGFLVLSSYLYQRTGAFVAKAVRAPGQVVRLHETDSSDASTTYAPVVEYTDDQGQRHEFVDSWSSSPPSYRTGDEVQVLYNPRNPREAQIDRGRANYWVSILIGSAGALFTFLGALSFKKLLKLQAANPFTCGF